MRFREITSKSRGACLLNNSRRGVKSVPLDGASASSVISWPRWEPRLRRIFEVVPAVVYHHTFPARSSAAELRKKWNILVFKCLMIVGKKNGHLLTTTPGCLIPDAPSLLYVTSLASESIGERGREGYIYRERMHWRRVYPSLRQPRTRPPWGGELGMRALTNTCSREQ